MTARETHLRCPRENAMGDRCVGVVGHVGSCCCSAAPDPRWEPAPVPAIDISRRVARRACEALGLRFHSDGAYVLVPASGRRLELRMRGVDGEVLPVLAVRRAP